MARNPQRVQEVPEVESDQTGLEPGTDDTTAGVPQAEVAARRTRSRGEEVSIAGQTFRIPNRYSEGHTLNANEATRLNQTLREVARAALTPKVKAGGLSQADVDSFLESFEFGTRQRGGGRVADPVETQARALARESVLKQLKARGQSSRDVGKEQMDAYITRALDNYPQFREVAKQMVNAKQSIALESLDEAA